MTFVPCVWTCEKCELRGEARAFGFPGEAPADVATRFAKQTRDRCVEGCRFTSSADAGALGPFVGPGGEITPAEARS